MAKWKAYDVERQNQDQKHRDLDQDEIIGAKKNCDRDGSLGPKTARTGLKTSL